jgi:hypothetical protein
MTKRQLRARERSTPLPAAVAPAPYAQSRRARDGTNSRDNLVNEEICYIVFTDYIGFGLFHTEDECGVLQRSFSEAY